MDQSSKKHDFNFEGGNYLRQIGASWFVSYSYYKNVDPNHRDWDKFNTKDSRISTYNATEKYHKIWLDEVSKMSYEKLNTNKIGLKGNQIKQMAKKILEKLGKQ